MRAGAAALCRLAGARAAVARQPVRISATTSVALFLAARLSDLTAAAPAAEIAVLSSRAQTNLAQREAEIALRMRHLPDAGALVARRLGRVAFAVYAGPGWTGRTIVGLPRTKRAPSQSQWLDAFARAQGADIVARASDVAGRRQAVAAGLGATLLPCFLGDGDPNLVRVGTPPAELAEDVYLLVHRDLAGAPAVRAVADALAALFQAARAALDGEPRPSAAVGVP